MKKIVDWVVDWVLDWVLDWVVFLFGGIIFLVPIMIIFGDAGDEMILAQWGYQPETGNPTFLKRLTKGLWVKNLVAYVCWFAYGVYMAFLMGAYFFIACLGARSLAAKSDRDEEA